MPIQLLLSDSLQITDGPHGLILHFNSQAFTLTVGREGSIITNTFLHIRSGINHARICEHLRDHQSTTAIAPNCPCCKMEGRVLSSSGRKTVRSDDLFRAVRAHSTGTVQVRHIAAAASRPSADVSAKVYKPNLSGAQLRAQEAALLKRTTPHSNVTRRVKQRIEDLI
jgi:hypothetical protein